MIEEPVNNIPLPPQEDQFTNFIQKYDHIFSTDQGLIKGCQCQIQITPGDPMHKRPYPIPMFKIKKMDQEIQRTIKLGIIEQSTSPWSSPIVGIGKKNGVIHNCLEARKINKRIIPDNESPMNIDEILLKFQGARYLSSIDLTAEYWQCPLKPECREITAFLYKGRNFQFKVLPLRLINFVAEFKKKKIPKLYFGL